MVNEKKVIKRATKWAEAEGCETGEAMLNLINVLEHFPDYVAGMPRALIVEALSLMQKDLKEDFRIVDGVLKIR